MNYYVRKSGSDAASGSSAGTAWLTIDKAANTMVAGDTVYVGAGVYRELVTMNTSGVSGSSISYIADVDGSKTGDAGLVIVSAYPSDETQATRVACLDPDGRIFITWRGFVFNGGTTAAVFSGNITDDNYEGCKFEDCVFQGGHDVGDFAFDVDMNAATTPTNNGYTFDRCMFGGRSRLKFDGNVTAEQNMKIAFNSCKWVVNGNNSSFDGFYWDLSTANTYGSGGLTFNACSWIGTDYGVVVDDGSATGSFNVAVYNSIFYRNSSSVLKFTDNDGALVENFNRFYQCSTERTNVTAGLQSRTDADLGPILMGAINDIPLYRFWGWSPYRPWEPIRLLDDTYMPETLGAGSSDYAPAFDLYNEARPQGTGEQQYYWFDVSDGGPTDNDAAWAGDASAFDSAIGNSANTTTTGSSTFNELYGQGTNAPSSGPTILTVRVRLYGSVSSAGNNTVGHAEVFTDGLGESLGSLTWNNAAATWTSWTTLSTPSGGWDYTKLAALEVVFWRTADSGAFAVLVASCQLEVQTVPADDIGAVEARARPEKETTTVRTGTNALRFEGAGYHDIFVPVAASSTTIAVYGRYDSDYTGTLPQLKIMNIPGVADQTDTMVGAANTWEELSINFTPTAVGVCRVRLVSNDTSRDGDCFFDDLTVT